METRSYYPNGKSSYNYDRNKHDICKYPRLVWSWSLNGSEVCMAHFSLRINTYQDWGVHDDDGKERYRRLSLRCGLRYLYDWSSDSSLLSTDPETVLVLSLTLMKIHILLLLPCSAWSVLTCHFSRKVIYPFDFQVWNSLLISGMILTYERVKRTIYSNG